MKGAGGSAGDLHGGTETDLDWKYQKSIHWNRPPKKKNVFEFQRQITVILRRPYCNCMFNVTIKMQIKPDQKKKNADKRL